MRFMPNRAGSYVFAAALVMSLAATAQADVVYTYTGNTFTSFIGGGSCPPECAITGSFTVAQALAANLGYSPPTANVTPIAFSFTDGAHTITQSSTTYPAVFSIGTDGSGAINRWVIGIYNSNQTVLLATDSPDNFGNTFDESAFPNGSGQDWGFVLNQPGTWSMAPVSEPATLAVFGLGLFGLAFSRRKKT